MSDIHRHGQRPSTPGVRHEETDVSLGGLLLFLGLLGLAGVMVPLAVSLIFHVFTGDHVTHRSGRALSSVELGTLPAEPVLEGLEPERGVASSRPPETYGWVDRERNIARIPVEKAKTILAGRLSSRPVGPESPTPNDANGGQPRKGPK